MKLSELEGKRILILGYGKEGRATEAFLARRLDHAIVDHADQKDGADYLERQKEYDVVIRSPGIPPDKVIANHTTATEIFFANFSFMTVGVTGTKGKSTTASLIAAMLKENGRHTALAGNIGIPLLEAVEHNPAEDTVFVMELSSYQLADLQFSPHISVVVNLYPEHMNYHGSVEAYMTAKKNIISHQKAGDSFLFHARDFVVSSWAKETQAQAIAVSGEFRLSPEDLTLMGEHNMDNIRIAAATARILGVPDDVIRRAVRTFHPLPHRLEKAGEFRGIVFYDDAISTTPESTICALRSVPGIGTLFLGGLDRGYRFDSLVEEIIRQGIANLVLFPDSGAKILALLRDTGKPLPRILETRDMKEAVMFAYRHTPPGKACLLSTASPSYSVWKNFEEKGDLFQKFMKELA